MASKTITQLTALNTVSTNLSNTLFVVYDTENNTTKKASLSQIDQAIERSIQNVTSAGSYANAAFAKANTLFDGTAEANVSSVTIHGVFDYAIEETMGGISINSPAGVFLNANSNIVTVFDDGTIRLPGTGFIYANDDNAGLRLYDTNNDYQAQLAAIGAVNIRANSANSGVEWDFGTDGTLTVPGNITGANVITATTISASNVISSNSVTANNLTVTGTLNVDGVNLLWHTPPTTSKGSAGDVAGLIAIDNDKLYRCIGTYDGTTDIWVFVNFTGGLWG